MGRWQGRLYPICWCNGVQTLWELLDANRWLSVQVHPDDAYALKYEQDLGKTEMWIVLHAEPDAEIIYGFKAGVDQAIFAQALAEERCEEWLNRLSIQSGDVVMVPAGSIHALGPGAIVAEIQQNSDTTYRIYDWGRPRPIHVEQALSVLNFELVEPGVTAPIRVPDHVYGPGVESDIIGQCGYFHTERIAVTGHDMVTIEGCCSGETFEIWAVLAGEANVVANGGSTPICAIEWVLLPASLGNFQIKGKAGCQLLRIYVP